MKNKTKKWTLAFTGLAMISLVAIPLTGCAMIHPKGEVTSKNITTTITDNNAISNSFVLIPMGNTSDAFYESVIGATTWKNQTDAEKQMSKELVNAWLGSSINDSNTYLLHNPAVFASMTKGKVNTYNKETQKIETKDGYLPSYKIADFTKFLPNLSKTDAAGGATIDLTYTEIGTENPWFINQSINKNDFNYFGQEKNQYTDIMITSEFNALTPQTATIKDSDGKDVQVIYPSSDQSIKIAQNVAPSVNNEKISLSNSKDPNNKNQVNKVSMNLNKWELMGKFVNIFGDGMSTLDSTNWAPTVYSFSFDIKITVYLEGYDSKENNASVDYKIHYQSPFMNQQIAKNV